jgi:hypothetical protein
VRQGLRSPGEAFVVEWTSNAFGAAQPLGALLTFDLLLATSRWPSQETAKPLGTQTMLSVADKQPTAKKFGAGFPEKLGYVK